MLLNSDFFILRASRLSEHDYLKIINHLDVIQILKNDRNGAIIKIASSALYDLLVEYDQTKIHESDFLRKNSQIIRSFLRACFRATPYGLSSTSTYGYIGEIDNISPSPEDDITSNIEASGEVVSSIINHFNSVNTDNGSIYMTINPSISIIGDRARYINNESTLDGKYVYYERELTKEDLLIIDFMQKPRRLNG